LDFFATVLRKEKEHLFFSWAREVALARHEERDYGSVMGAQGTSRRPCATKPPKWRALSSVAATAAFQNKKKRIENAAPPDAPEFG